LKTVQVLRLYYAGVAALAVVWIVNALVVATRPSADWYEALGMPIVLTLLIWVRLIMSAPAKIAADPDSSVRLGRRHYYVAVLAAVVLLVAFVAGILANSGARRGRPGVGFLDYWD